MRRQKNQACMLFSEQGRRGGSAAGGLRRPDGPVIARSIVIALPDALRAAQRAFDETGGLHAAALFSTAGELLAIHEDVGRHNALDKLVGSQVLAGALPLHDRVLMVSGRVSFEIVQKAVVAGIPIICAVSAPSDLAVETAERLIREEIERIKANPE